MNPDSENKMDRTIIYYTSNRENPEFEAKIRNNILKLKGSLPIISVSQKPIDFGINICVGDVGLSYLNEFRQIYLGACEAKTPYLIFAESDFLYPPEYFSFIPAEKNQCYRYDNNYIVYDTPKHNYFYKKRETEGAQIVDRELYINKCEQFFAGMPKWFSEGKGGRMPIKRREPVAYIKKIFINGVNPCITFKTGKGVSWRAHIERGKEKKRLPYWGKIDDVKRQYL